MAWYDVKAPAADPDNPTADEQVTATEWNAMVLELRNRLIGKDVDDSNLADDRILVYDLASDTFVFEDQAGISELNDIPDVTISGVPADNEVIAYDSGTSKFINQTAAEAGLATVTGLASYLPLAGGTMTGTLNMGDYLIDDVKDLQAYDVAGILFKNNSAVSRITLATISNSFVAAATSSMGGYAITNVLDPSAAQDASTKNYADTHLFTKEVVTSFLDGYIPVYKTASGKFEMEAGGGSAGLPVTDTTNIVKGSADGTKLMRFEVDGITTGTTRVMTVPDKDITLCDTAEVMLLSGTQAMTADMDMGDNSIVSIDELKPYDTVGIRIQDSTGVTRLMLGKSTYAFFTYQNVNMNKYDIEDIGALILSDATQLTIGASLPDMITVTQSYHTVETAGAAASDELHIIDGGTTGQIVVLKAANDAHTVVVKDNADNIQLEGDMSLDNLQDTLTLIYDGSNWLEISRSNNGA